MLKRALIPLAAGLFIGGCATTPAPVGTATSADTVPGLVSAADPRAAEAGVRMLRKGGSATDAAIATMLALTVVEPQSSGIGGGGFYLRGTQGGGIETLDGRETAPAGADPDWFIGPDGEPRGFTEAVLTGLSIGVPGNVALAAEAHGKHGRLDWAELFGPAIALARNGFVVTERFNEYLGFASNRATLTEEGRALFYGEDGEPLPVGTRITNPELAESLEALARQGPGQFYGEENAAGIAEVAAEATPREGAMTAGDITSYQALWRDAPCGDYRGYRICGMGPPSSGATTVFAILKQLENFDLSALGPDNATSWHLFAESQRLAYADREIYLADSDYVQVPVAGLMDGDYLLSRGGLIGPDARIAEPEAGTPPGLAVRHADGTEPIESGTSHFVAVDGEGTAVSWTSTIEGPFGSGRMHGGYFLNNELTDFSFRPETDGRTVANRVEGGKRPRSSMAPTIVFDPDGDLYLAIGAAGGGTIPVQVAKALIGVIDWGLPVGEAIALPGLYSPGDTISVETDSPLLRFEGELEAMGHTVEARRLPFKANAAQRVNGRWIGAADPRSEGQSISE